MVFSAWPWTPWGPKNGQKGPFGATHGKNGVDSLIATKISFVYPVEFSRFMHKWPGSAVSPRGHQPFSAISQNAFWSMDLRNGPESCFCSTNPTIIWEKGNLGPLSLAGTSLLLGRMPEVNAPFWLPRAQKTAKTACFGQ